MTAPATPLRRSRPTKRFKILSFEEVEAQPTPTWRVDGVLPSNGFAMLYGPPGVGKTFLALDLALAVASGQPWAARRTMPGHVLYVVAEGVAGFQQRLKAGALARSLATTSVRVHFISESVQLHSPAEVDALLAAVAEHLSEPVALVVFDTLSRCFVGGEENSAKDIGKLIEGADRIRKQTGATVLLVHHTTKDGNSERGSSALRGSADVMLGVSANKGVVVLECEKQKDAAPFNPIRLRLVETCGSCAVQVADASKRDPDTVSSGALAALTALGQNGGLRCKDWLSASGIPPGTFYRYLEEVKQAELVTQEGNLYVLTETGRAALTPT